MSSFPWIYFWWQVSHTHSRIPRADSARYIYVASGITLGIRGWVTPNQLTSGSSHHIFCQVTPFLVKSPPIYNNVDVKPSSDTQGWFRSLNQCRCREQNHPWVSKDGCHLFCIHLLLESILSLCDTVYREKKRGQLRGNASSDTRGWFCTLHWRAESPLGIRGWRKCAYIFNCPMQVERGSNPFKL